MHVFLSIGSCQETSFMYRNNKNFLGMFIFHFQKHTSSKLGCSYPCLHREG